MEKTRSFFGSKWAVVVAFVPIVNLLYVLFAFLLRGTDRFFFRLINFAVVCVAGAALHFFPDYGWLIAYAVLAAMALVDLNRIRESDYTLVRSFWLRLAAISMPVLLLVIAVFYKPFNSEKALFLREQTQAALEAIIQDDTVAWRELEYDSSVYSELNWLSLRQLRQKLIGKGSLPEGEIGALIQCRAGHTGSFRVPAYTATYLAEIGGVSYFVDVEYTEGSQDAGFSFFDITRAD